MGKRKEEKEVGACQEWIGVAMLDSTASTGHTEVTCEARKGVLLEKDIFSFENSWVKNYVLTRHQWLTPIILTTWEAEIRRTKV
jgi:hypothetical protein